MIRFCLLAVLLAASGAPVFADERTLSVTDFDTIRVIGSMHVIVSEGYATSLRVSGDPHDLDTLTANVQGQRLVIKAAHFGWGSSAEAHGPLTVHVSTPHLRIASLSGSGALEIAHMRDPKVLVGLEGSGTVRVVHVEAENLTAFSLGSGRMILAGTAAQAGLSARGSGVLDAGALTVKDLKLNAQGASSLTAQASREASIDADGSSDVTVQGTPACTVHSTSAGHVICGDRQNQQ